MQKTFSVTFFLFIFLSTLKCQTFYFEFLPDSLHFATLRANHQEARIGILYYPENGHLKVDIGNTVDLLSFHLGDVKLNFGIEFMAYASSTNFQGKRLQIDAIDGFFGGNSTFSIPGNSSTLYGRFRIIHNSAHFVDGHYDTGLKQWENNSEPIPFTQDFGELTLANEHYLSFGSTQYYGSVAYATLVRPHEIKKYSFNTGIEINSNKILGLVFEHEANLFLASHIRYAGLPNYKFSINNMFGLKFGNWKGKGITFYFSYYNGNNIFNEYYYLRISKFGIGFTVDFI